MPYGFDLTKIKSSLTTASTSGGVIVDVRRNGVSIFSAQLGIDANQKTSATAATPPTLITTSLTDDDEMFIDVSAAGTGAKGLKVYFIGRQSEVTFVPTPAGPKRFWRLDQWVLAAGGGLNETTEYRLYENGVDVTNLCSYAYNPGLSAGNAGTWKDGSLSNPAYWSTTPAGLLDCTIIADFGGTPKGINAVRVGSYDNAGRYPLRFRLSWSTDGVAWTVVGTCADISVYPGNNTLGPFITF
jgi:hypothetical protein